jgi:tRNA G18 (ribose-2'-O)-methylase SpoU
MDELQSNGDLVFTLESTVGSNSLFSSSTFSSGCKSIVLVLGNEISGIDPVVLQKADFSLHIPMAGTKTSMNVAVAAGVTLYWLIGELNHIQKND